MPLPFSSASSFLPTHIGIIATHKRAIREAAPPRERNRTKLKNHKWIWINTIAYFPAWGANFSHRQFIIHGPQTRKPKLRERKREPQRRMRGKKKLSNQPSSFPFVITHHIYIDSGPILAVLPLPARLQRLLCNISTALYCELGTLYCHTMIWEQSEGIPFSLARSSSTTSCTNLMESCNHISNNLSC